MTEKTKVVDEMLLEYGTPTDRQREAVEAINAEGGIVAAARKLGVHHSTLQEHLDKLRKKASLRGYSPEDDARGVAPSTHIAKGKSILFGGDGSIKQTWLKTDLNREAYNEIVRQAIGEFLKDIPPLPVVSAPLDVQEDIIPWIQIGDAHLGMLAHAAETTDNFDLKIAERELLAAIFQLIDEMPACARIVINDLGDFTHYENMAGVTEASGHALDYDGRFPKMIRAYVRIMRAVVERALTKAQHVDVIVNQGNHSRTNDFWMAELLRAAYSHTKRVHVVDNDNVFIGYRMGKTLVMIHHSDKCRPKELVGVMITDFRKDFGETEFHYIDTGHVHHSFVSKEYPSVLIESWNHLAPNDKYSHDGGWRSRKSISVVLRSRTYGDVGRRHLPIEEVRDRISRASGINPAAKKEAYAV